MGSQLFQGGNRALPEDRDLIVRFRVEPDDSLFRLVYRAPLRDHPGMGAGFGIGPALLLPQFCGPHEIPETIADLHYQRDGTPPTNIYLIQDQESGLVKIGRSRNPRQRLSDLRVGGRKLVLLLFFPGIVADEESFHKALARKRVRGEWFRLSGGDIERFRILKTELEND